MSDSPFRRSCVAAAAGTALAAGLVAGPPASAVPEPPVADPPVSALAYRNYYGAIALATVGGAVGWSYDFRTKKRAFKVAMRECRKASSYPWSCRKVAWVRNWCIGLAVLWDADNNIAYYDYGAGRTKKKAYRKALRKCGPGCVRRAYTCTTR